MPAAVRYLQFWLFLLYCSYLSLTPSPHAELIETFSDKFLHFTGYLLLVASCNMAYAPGRRLPVKIALLFGYSLLIEGAQHFIPNRSFSLGDLGANLFGLLVGGACLFLLQHLRTPDYRQPG
ncbi:MAG: VanZ family protein [Desulfuromonadales bacterium]|jgi:VanZ family protein|nr:VanZ family protein [Desulfuromonadales bacterium]